MTIPGDPWWLTPTAMIVLCHDAVSDKTVVVVITLARRHMSHAVSGHNDEIS